MIGKPSILSLYTNSLGFIVAMAPQMRVQIHVYKLAIGCISDVYLMWHVLSLGIHC